MTLPALFFVGDDEVPDAVQDAGKTAVLSELTAFVTEASAGTVIVGGVAVFA